MKQTINLLPRKHIEQANGLSFKALLIIIGISGCGSLLLAMFFGWQGYQWQSKLEEQQQVSAKVTQQLDALKLQLSARNESTVLGMQLKGHQKQRLGMQKMLEYTEQQTVSSATGFVSSIEALQSSLSDKARLESFKISAGPSISLMRGAVEQASDLPKLLTKLRAVGLLQAQRLASIKIIRDGDEYQFSIVSAEKEVEL
jgi:hypothetical protein